MAVNKTKQTRAGVGTFLSSIKDKDVRADCQEIIAMMKRIAKEEPRMWGPSMIGFGTRHYRYDSGREGDIFRIGFSPRKTALTIYLGAGIGADEAAFKKLGKFKLSGGCLSIKKLADVDTGQLTKLVAASFRAHV